MKCKAKWKRHPEKKGQKCQEEAIKKGLCVIHLAVANAEAKNGTQHNVWTFKPRKQG